MISVGNWVIELNEDIAYRIGRATAQSLRAKTVVVGFDARATSPDLARCCDEWHLRCWRRRLGYTPRWYRGNVRSSFRVRRLRWH